MKKLYFNTLPKILIFLFIIKPALQESCPSLPKLKSPINIFHDYIWTFYKVLKPSEND